MRIAGTAAQTVERHTTCCCATAFSRWNRSVASTTNRPRYPPAAMMKAHADVEAPRAAAGIHGASKAKPDHTGARQPTASNSESSSKMEEHTSELQSRGHLVCRL